jgi:hypothetical protein
VAIHGDLSATTTRFAGPARPGRGPVAAQPVLSAEHQHQFFNRLLSAADSKVATDMAVLRRQAIYLLGFDQRSESADWLAAQHTRVFGGRKTEDPTSGIAARSAAVALARRGDSDPLRYFIRNTLSDERHAAANLAYWAYWLGEINEPYGDDGFLVASTVNRAWAGVRLADHLLEHLTDQVNGQLNVHSLWHLVLARPELLRYNSHLRRRVADRVEEALDNGSEAHSSAELNSLRCAVQLANR